jgi:ribosomal protein S18 acetylase RimI-like enzyme
MHPRCRRQGYGRQLVMGRGLGVEHQGAQTAYLQVMLGNAPHRACMRRWV